LPSRTVEETPQKPIERGRLGNLWWVLPCAVLGAIARMIESYPQIPGLVNVYKKLWKDPPFLMGKLTISMVIFNNYVTNYQRVFWVDYGVSPDNPSWEKIPSNVIGMCAPGKRVPLLDDLTFTRSMVNSLTFTLLFRPINNKKSPVKDRKTMEKTVMDNTNPL
jgi:hypothetical protein